MSQIGLIINQWSLPHRIFWVILATGLGAIATAFFVVSWMAVQIDTVTQEKSVVLIESALEAEKNRIGTITRDYGYWDAAYEWFAADDAEELYNNMGTIAADDGTFDGLYLVSADGTPQYAYAYGEKGSDTARYPRAVGDYLRHQVLNLPMFPHQSVDSFAIIDGQLTVFVASRLQLTQSDNVDPSSWPILIGVRTLDNDALSQMGGQLMLHNLALIGPDAPVPDGTSAAGLMGVFDAKIGQIIWENERPGATLMYRTAPFLLFIAGLVVVISYSVARIFARQTETYITEHNNARTDGLTGLLNRAGLDELANSPEVQSALKEGKLAVVYADLNNFKSLNDTYGHDAGDAALRITANRLHAAVRAKDRVARAGGDEFVCVLISNQPLQDASMIAERMHATTAPVMSINGRSHHVPAAIGYAVSRSDDDWDSLLARADKAMFSAKRKRQTSLKLA